MYRKLVFFQGIWTYELAKSVFYYTELEKKKKNIQEIRVFLVNMDIYSRCLREFGNTIVNLKISNSLGYFQIPSGSGNICPYSLEKPEFPLQITLNICMYLNIVIATNKIITIRQLLVISQKFQRHCNYVILEIMDCFRKITLQYTCV